MRAKFLIILILAGLGLNLAAKVVSVYKGEKPLATIPPEAFLSRAKNAWLEPAKTSVLSGESQDAENSVLSAKNNSSAVQPLKFNCTGIDSGDFDCYERYYAKLTSSSIEDAFADLKERYPKNNYVRAQCHPLTHVIGRAASEKFATPGDAYIEGDPFCWSGYYHGVLEGIIGKIGLKNLPNEMNSICKSIHERKGYGFDYYNCVHGLGHGVMAITEDELFKSLNYCDKLVGNWEQISCASGAFMENIIVDGKNHKTNYLRPDEPLYPCTETPEKYKDTCYLMQTSYMLKVNGRDFKKTFGWCGEVESAYRATCYQSLGRDASGGTSSNVLQTKAICLLGADREQKSNCVIGAVKDFISYFHSDVQAKQFCGSFEDQDLQNTCLNTATTYYSQF